MFSKRLINIDIPTLKILDKGTTALDIMERFKISDLPIIDENNKLIGIISETEILDLQLENITFKDARVNFRLFYIEPNVSFFEVLEAFKKYQSTIVPVVSDSQQKYLGLISPYSVIKYLYDLPIAESNYFTLYLLMPRNDYTSTHISNIIENNNSRLYGLLYSQSGEDVEVLLKIQSNDIESVIQSFEHFGYKPLLLNVNSEKYNDFYRERLENLLKFINI